VTCRFRQTLEMKKSQQFSFVSAMPDAFTYTRIQHVRACLCTSKLEASRTGTACSTLDTLHSNKRRLRCKDGHQTHASCTTGHPYVHG
jgi:hypothetical protein